MAYGTTLEAEFFKQRSVMRLLQTPEGTRAVVLLLELRNHSAAAGTDGSVERFELRSATIHDDPEGLLALLVNAGLVTATRGGWQLDWSGQKSMADREKEREEWRWKAKHRRGDHSECPATWACRKKAESTEGSPPGESTSGQKKRRGEEGVHQGSPPGESTGMSKGDLREGYLRKDNPSRKEPDLAQDDSSREGSRSRSDGVAPEALPRRALAPEFEVGGYRLRVDVRALDDDPWGRWFLVAEFVDLLPGDAFGNTSRFSDGTPWRIGSGAPRPADVERAVATRIGELLAASECGVHPVTGSKPPRRDGWTAAWLYPDPPDGGQAVAHGAALHLQPDDGIGADAVAEELGAVIGAVQRELIAALG